MTRAQFELGGVGGQDKGLEQINENSMLHVCYLN